ncbi:hypothetical protein SAMN05444358_102245 [Ruegeria halocynthiae]|uniref:Metallo-beta-lactamase superfamily protein n=1 Tax=Ruegeria halocynthiae TaxID=985054 RepID=A0A1H2YF02_9RHOB|nr:hypothetical protein [Ruegeria halocynthiae]SDX03214.1 hypothetical protein SAMN05444358_102245 [Ruegeria halocynthiae]
MNNIHSEEPLDGKHWEWRQACQCAEVRVCSDIARNYGLSLIAEGLFRSIEEDISDDVLEHALEHIKQSFNTEAIHKECQDFLEKERKDAEHLSARTARLPSSHSRAWKRDDTRHVLGHHRYQLPVGQGGFHVGTLRNLGLDEAVWRSSLGDDAIPLADFMYVYDCGAIPIAGAVKAVRSIVCRRVSRRLDMLFVSHFDRDHICGIPHLLHPKKGLQVDTIVMPYLDDIERIIAFGRSAATSAEPRAERFYRDIVVDPIGTMTQFAPRQIVMVASGEEGDTDPGFFELPPTEPPRSDPDGPPWKINGAGSPRSGVPSARRTPEGAIVVQKVEFNIADGIEGGWLLKPHVKKAPLQDREAFCAAVEVMLKWPRGSFRKKAQSKEVRRLLVTKHRTTLSRAYAWAFGEKNETSMSLYSGPTKPEEAGAVVYKSKERDCARVGWLGTGDACLLDPQTVRKYQDHYSEELDWVTTFMLPHHGSAHNFDPDLPVVDAELWVAAAQPKNSTWKHPAPGIVKAIKASGAKFRKVDSSPNSLLVERMVVFWPG